MKYILETFMFKHVLLFTLLMTTIFSNQVEDTETFSFAGLTATGSKVDFKGTSNLTDSKNTLVGLRYGQQTVDWRTMFTLSGKKETQEFTLEIDKILMDDIFGYPEVRPYLGATIGILHYEDAALTEEDGYFFGGAFGFLIYLTDNIDLDISYHYKKIKDMEPLSNIRGASIGVHYFY
ncbi:MAG: hypothetical protein L3J43_00775 [Sulfurovum sp.]|nr:hypothetical protein [Sulfurovum sp.]